MINSLKNLYNEFEASYLEFEDKLLDNAVDLCEDAKEFFTEKDLSLPIDGNDKISQELSNIQIYANKTERIRQKEWEENLKLLGVSLGHFNEASLKKLSLKFNIEYNSRSISKTIKNFDEKKKLPKSVIGDLYFLNSFRNKIIHYDEYYYDLKYKNRSLSDIDNMSKQVFDAEIKCVKVKSEILYAYFLKDYI